jgi:hypothetical protein
LQEQQAKVWTRSVCGCADSTSELESDEEEEEDELMAARL